MADPASVLPDKVRVLEARVARLEDRCETLEHQRTTWLPGRSAGNLPGRHREAILVGALFLIWMVARSFRRTTGATTG